MNLQIHRTSPVKSFHHLNHQLTDGVVNSKYWEHYFLWHQKIFMPRRRALASSSVTFMKVLIWKHWRKCTNGTCTRTTSQRGNSKSKKWCVLHAHGWTFRLYIYFHFCDMQQFEVFLIRQVMEWWWSFNFNIISRGVLQKEKFVLKRPHGEVI